MTGRLGWCHFVVLDNQSLDGLVSTVDQNDVPAPKITGSGGKQGQTLTYSAVRADPSATNPVQYYWDFGDSTNSGWQDSNTVSKSWSNVGTYNLSVKTKCKEHGIESESGTLPVNIGNPDGPDLKVQWQTTPYKSCTTNKKKGTKCSLKGGKVLVANVGNQSSTATSLDFKLSDDATLDESDPLMKEINVAALKPGKYKSITLPTQNFAYGVSLTGKYIFAFVNGTDNNPANNLIIYGPLQ